MMAPRRDAIAASAAAHCDIVARSLRDKPSLIAMSMVKMRAFLWPIRGHILRAFEEPIRLRELARRLRMTAPADVIFDFRLSIHIDDDGKRDILITSFTFHLLADVIGHGRALAYHAISILYHATHTGASKHHYLMTLPLFDATTMTLLYVHGERIRFFSYLRSHA